MEPYGPYINYRYDEYYGRWISDSESDDDYGSYRPNLGLGGRDTGYAPRLPTPPPPPPPPPPPTPPPTPPPPTPVTYTPTVSNGNVGGTTAINLQTSVSQAVSTVDSQDPNGIKWITAATWNAGVWDGTPIAYQGMTTAQLCAAVFSSTYVMRGLRERFYQVNPFADNANPTASEIDLWNLEVIRHLRTLLGITTPVYPDKCLYLRAQWGQERKFSNYWDAEYPGTFDSASGPCLGGSNAHCGATFLPSTDDQQPYGAPTGFCSLTAGAEAVQTVNTDLPWAIKLAFAIRKFICTEGITGHSGPFLGRELFGAAWHVAGATTHIRFKWGGTLTAP